MWDHFKFFLKSVIFFVFYIQNRWFLEKPDFHSDCIENSFFMILCFQSGERPRAIFAENRPPRADFLRTAPNGIVGLEFIPGSRGSRGSRGNGVRSHSSDPPKHAQESQDDVSSQANSLKQTEKFTVLSMCLATHDIALGSQASTTKQ